MTHPNVSVNSLGDYGLVPASFSAVCQVSSASVSPGYIEENLTLSSDVLWVLDGAVHVGLSIAGGAQNPVSDSDGQFAAVLTIEPGATVIGDYNESNPSSNLDYLVVHRGSRLHAVATETAPIRLTSRQAVTGEPEQPGQWGGLIVNGYARVNHCSTGSVVVDCEASAQLGGGQFGGNDDGDSSGALAYVRVENAGFQLSANSGFSALSLNGLGSQTSIDRIQVHNSGGVSLSINGGAVNIQRIIITEAVNAGLVWSNGWVGTMQHLLAITPASGSSAVVGRNHENGVAVPQSSPVLVNSTLIADSADSAVVLADNTSARLLGQVIVSPAGSCYQHGGALPESLEISHSYINCTTGAGQAEDDWFTNGLFTINSESVVLNAYINNDFLLQALKPPVADIEGAESVNYIGAVGFCVDDWTKGWSVALPVVDQEQCLQPGLQIPLLNSLSFTGLSLLLAGVANVFSQR